MKHKRSKYVFIVVLILCLSVLLAKYYANTKVVVSRLLTEEYTINNKELYNKVNKIIFKDKHEPLKTYEFRTGPMYSLSITKNDITYWLGLWPDMISLIVAMILLKN